MFSTIFPGHHLEQGAPTPPWPVQNRAVEEASEHAHSSTYAHSGQVNMHRAPFARHSQKWSCVHPCSHLLFVQNPPLFPLPRSAKPERLETTQKNAHKIFYDIHLITHKGSCTKRGLSWEKCLLHKSSMI